MGEPVQASGSFVIFKADFRNDREQPGYSLHLRAWGAIADKVSFFVPGERVLVYGSFWNRSRKNLAWIEVDYIAMAEDLINCFTAIGRVFKQPTTIRDRTKFPIVINRTIDHKHYYAMTAVGNASKLSQSSVSQGDLIQCEGFIDLIIWTNKEGEVLNFLRFTTTIIKRY